jgi:hypothetical protein
MININRDMFDKNGLAVVNPEYNRREFEFSIGYALRFSNGMDVYEEEDEYDYTTRLKKNNEFDRITKDVESIITKVRVVSLPLFQYKKKTYTLHETYYTKTAIINHLKLGGIFFMYSVKIENDVILYRGLFTFDFNLN